jgi:hypothetical protein
MPNWLRFLALAVGIGIPATAGRAAADTKEPPGPAPGSLERLGYRPAPGAQVIGAPTRRPGGDEVAFFERNGATYALVVVLPHVAPARWTVTESTTRLHIYWMGPTELSLGTDALAPKMVVRWQVSRSSATSLRAAPSSRPS